MEKSSTQKKRGGPAYCAGSAVTLKAPTAGIPKNFGPNSSASRFAGIASDMWNASPLPAFTISLFLAARDDPELVDDIAVYNCQVASYHMTASRL